MARVEANPDSLAASATAPLTTDHGQLTTDKIGMISFLVSEVAFFSTLIVAYVVFLGGGGMLVALAILGKDSQPAGGGGPTPAEVLSLPLVIGTTICLLSSSVTIHLADRALQRGEQSRFCLLWAGTIILGVLFLLGTAHEWNDLIFHRGLTISRNMFGTTYYTLVGFHAAHVTVGVIVMLIMLGLALRRRVTVRNRTGVELVSWYWHFVDGVWVVVFTVVYLLGR